MAAALDSHHQLNENFTSISITSQSPLVQISHTVEYLGKPHNFPEMIKMIIDMNGIPFFTSIKVTKLSESASRFPLLMMKDKLKSAEQALDIFLKSWQQKATTNQWPMIMNKSPKPTSLPRTISQNPSPATAPNTPLT
jgi:hypothetical protein